MLNIKLNQLATNIDMFVNWGPKAKEGQTPLREPEFYSDQIIQMFMEGCQGLDSEEIRGNISGFVTEKTATPFVKSDKELAELLHALANKKVMQKRAKRNEKAVEDEKIFSEAIFLDFLTIQFTGKDEDEIYFELIDLG